MVDLGSQRGKVVIVTFWASRCGPCRRELPILGRLQNVIGRDALQAHAVNLKEPRTGVAAIARSHNAPPLDCIPDAKGEASNRCSPKTRATAQPAAGCTAAVAPRHAWLARRANG